jgi:hypothetical protein
VTRPIRTSEPASDEFSEAVRWYEARRSGLGGEFFDAVAAIISLIETSPEIGAPIATDGQTRRALVSRFPYQVVLGRTTGDLVHQNRCQRGSSFRARQR